MRLRRFASFVSILALTTAAFGAAPLADRVPADAIAYAGWAGQGQVKNYDGSHLQAVLAESNAPKVVTEFLPKVFDRIAREDRRNAAAWRAVGPLVAQVGKYPSAFFFAGLTQPPRGQDPMPKVGLIVRAGADTKALFAQVDKAITAAGAADVKLAEAGEHLILAVGYSAEEMTKLVDPAASGTGLAASDGFKAALGKVSADPTTITYLDVEKLIAMTERLNADASGAAARAAEGNTYPAFLDASGLRGAKRYVSTGAIDGKDWVTQAFVDAPAPRTGLLSLAESGPVSDDLLRCIPADATYAKAGKFDAAKALRTVREVVAKTDPEAGKQVDQALGAATLYVGRNVQNDVLEPLGTDWALYFSPTVAGTGLYGVVVVNKLDDPAKASQSMQAVSFAINNGLAAAMKREKWKVPGRQVKVGNLSIYYVGTPLVSPAWTVANGNLYLGLYPQVVAAAARHDGGGATTKPAFAAKSLLDNPKFTAVRKTLGGQPAGGLTFVDLETLAGQGWGYQYMMALSRTALGFGDIFGIESPEMVLPPLDVLTPHLAPTGRVAWAGDDGLHATTRSPFPGASLLTEQGIASQAGLGYSTLATSILLPSLNRAHESANRVKCASNLRQIGQACLLFANENRGRYPADIAEMVRTQDIGAVVFTCPSAGDDLPAEVRAAPLDAQAKWAMEHGHYVYLGAGKMGNALTPDTVVAYERDENHDGDGMNMLFGDGHVEWVMMPRARQLIEEQQGAPGEQ